ncbi:MAG: IS110 family transposase, partial [Actinomycetota bacterium]|nr:IS110 family transposase [Actinomycetota bacterium]
IDRVGIEGTGSYGAGLSRHFTRAGVEVLEVCRHDRQRRRMKGKSDTVDAEAAARAALARDMVSTPKTGVGRVEAIRALRIPRNSAMKARTQVANQIHTLIDTAPDNLRAQLRGRKIAALVDEMARWRPGPPTNPTEAHRLSLRLLARRWQQLSAELAELDEHITDLVQQTAPELVAVRGVGIETAATLLVAAGDNPERLHREQGFAALCGVSPVDRSSGRQRHHSLNRGGNRDANRALWRIALVRMHCDPDTRAYVERRTKDGKSKKAIIRCLKRYIAREIYPILLGST